MNTYQLFIEDQPLEMYKHLSKAKVKKLNFNLACNPGLFYQWKLCKINKNKVNGSIKQGQVQSNS